MVKQVAAPLPKPGEKVRVAWGLGSVDGTVLESYSGIRPRVVVEIDAGEVGDEATTITVPLGALEPRDEAASPWAEEARFELSLAHALQRVLGDRLRELDLNAELPNAEVDLLVHLADGRDLVVEVKRRTQDATSLRRTMRWLTQVAKSQGALALLVVPANASAPDESGSDLVRTVAWSSEEDDPGLKTALRQLLAT